MHENHETQSKHKLITAKRGRKPSFRCSQVSHLIADGDVGALASILPLADDAVLAERRVGYGQSFRQLAVLQNDLGGERLPRERMRDKETRYHTAFLSGALSGSCTAA